MKKLLAASFFVCITTVNYAQDLPDFSAVKIEKKEDFNADADGAALKAANYLFATPIAKENIDRLKCIRYILKWMNGTPEYSFSLDQDAMKFAKKNDEMIYMYMAGMTKYVLENEADAKNEGKVKLNAVKLVVGYAKDPKNNVKTTSELKKAIEADEKDQLAAYLKIQTS